MDWAGNVVVMVLVDPVTGEAARWYDEEGYLGLGDRFVGTFYSGVAHLQEHGEIH